MDVNFGKITSMHFHAWKSGLKTGMYYLRTKAAADAIKFTVNKEALKQPEPEAVKQEVAAGQKTTATVAQQTLEEQKAAIACSIDNPDDCEMCGS